MKIENPTQEDIDFYSQFGTYKMIHKNSDWQYISVSSKDIWCPIPFTVTQRRYLDYCIRSINKGGIMQIGFAEFERLLASDCMYCGDSTKGSIDRIDSKQGYIVGNVQPVCAMCNFMKYTATHCDFINQIEKIARYRHII